jgi:hypothetical protein
MRLKSTAPACIQARRHLEISLILALTIGELHAAPYGQDVMEIEWQQPYGLQQSPHNRKVVLF